MALFQSPLCSALGTTEDDPIGQLNRSLRQQEFNHRAHLSDSSLGRHSSTFTQVIWIFFWLIVLLVFAYPLAFVAALIYALLNPFNIVDCCQPAMQFILYVLNLPYTCAKNMVEAKQLIVM